MTDFAELQQRASASLAFVAMLPQDKDAIAEARQAIRAMREYADRAEADLEKLIKWKGNSENANRP